MGRRTSLMPMGNSDMPEKKITVTEMTLIDLKLTSSKETIKT